MQHLLYTLENLISGFLPFCLLIIGGIYLTVKSRFFQIKGLFKSFSLVKKAYSKKENQTDGISSLQAATTALSATVGTGNIVGVAGAVSLGGAGAVFWMWIAAFMGMIVKYAEIALGIIFRENNTLKGGPMYYIKKGLPKNFGWLGTLFCLVAVVSTISSGNITQTNAAISSFKTGFWYKLLLGSIFGLLCFLALKGGIKRIGKITEKLTPVMSLLYFFVCLCVILKNLDFLGAAFKMILKGAFSPKAVTGGVVGNLSKTMFLGASRGVFSNEAGLGTSSIAHSAAFDANHKTQGLYGIFEVFCDTIVICTLTALTILCSRVNIHYGYDFGFLLVENSLKTVFSNSASFLLSLMLCFFSFSSVIGWALYGKICISYLNKSQKFQNLFTVVYPLFCVLGAVLNTAFAWRIAAFFNGIMLICNLPAVVFLSGNLFEKEGQNFDKDKNKKITGNIKK